MFTKVLSVIFTFAIFSFISSNIPKPKFECTFFEKKNILPIKKIKKTAKKTSETIKVNIVIWAKSQKVKSLENNKYYYIIGTAMSKNKEIRYIIQKKAINNEGGAIFEGEKKRGEKRTFYIELVYIREMLFKIEFIKI